MVAKLIPNSLPFRLEREASALSLMAIRSSAGNIDIGCSDIFERGTKPQPHHSRIDYDDFLLRIVIEFTKPRISLQNPISANATHATALSGKPTAITTAAILRPALSISVLPDDVEEIMGSDARARNLDRDLT
jgi:hypothetical protein